VTSDEEIKPFYLMLPCAACGRRTCRIELFPSPNGPPGRWRFVYEGIEAGNADGDDISTDEAARIIHAFSEPLSYERVHTAGLYDDAGYCGECDCSYCPQHWHPSRTGYGHCPRGHGKSLDPHWSPEDLREDD
jgi:hypothetical protein